MTTEIQKFENEDALYAQREHLLQQFAPLVKVDDQNVQAVATLVKYVDDFCKKVKNARLEITRQIDAMKKRFTDKEHDLTDELLQWKAKAQKMTGEYLTEKERQRIEAEKERARIEAENALLAEEEARKAVEEAKAAALFGLQPPTPPVENTPPPPKVEIMPPKVEKTFVSNVRQVKVARFEITDATAVPRQFLMVDEKAVQQYANDAMKQGIELDKLQVAGIRFYSEIRADVK